MNSKPTPFDISKTGERVEAEKPAPSPIEKDKDVTVMDDERNKMLQEGIFAPRHEFENRMTNVEDQIKEFLKRHETKKSVGYFINRQVVHQILKIHPFIKTKRQLASLSKIPNSRHSQLSLKTKKWSRVNKKYIKNMAKVLEIQNWKVLVDHEMMKSYDTNQLKAKKYLDQIKQIEKSVINESPDSFKTVYSLDVIEGE